MTRRTLDAMALGGMYDLVGGGFHRYSVDAQWLVPHFEKMLYDNALLAGVYLHASRRFDEPRYAEVAERTIDYVLRELALDGGGFASAQDADTDGVEGLTFTWAPGEGAPEELLQPFEHGRFVLRGELDEETRARALRAPRASSEAAPRRQGDRVVERADARHARAGAAASTRPSRWAEFLLGPLSTRGRPPAPDLARRRREGHGLPRGLRRRRERPARAARRDRRPALAARGAPPRHARRRALRRRRGWRLLPDARRRRAARRAQEGARRPSDAERQRDDRVRPAAARAHLGRRRARAARRLGAARRPRLRRASAVGLRLDARRARPAPRTAPRDRDRRRRGMRPSRGLRWRALRRPTWSRSARPTTSRSSAGARR